MSLELIDVVLAISGRLLVNHVSLQLEPGEVVGLLGPNGAGKTTTFGLVTGLLRWMAWRSNICRCPNGPGSASATSPRSRACFVS